MREDGAGAFTACRLRALAVLSPGPTKRLQRWRGALLAVGGLRGTEHYVARRVVLGILGQTKLACLMLVSYMTLALAASSML